MTTVVHAVVDLSIAEIKWDDEMPQYNYQSRAADPNWNNVDCPPAWFESGPKYTDEQGHPLSKMGDYRTNVNDLLNQILRINDYDQDRFDYIMANNTMLFNGEPSYPRLNNNQQWGLCSGNKIKVLETVPGFVRFKTVNVGTDDVHLLTSENCPWLVHHMTLICWNSGTKQTTRKTTISNANIPGLPVRYFLAGDGSAWIQDWLVKQ